MAFIPNIPSSLGAISELDKVMMVAKHKGASVAGGRRQVNVAVGRDRRMASRLASARPQGRRCRGRDVTAAPQKREDRESK